MAGVRIPNRGGHLGWVLAIFQNPAGTGTIIAQSFAAIFVGMLIGGIVAAAGTYASIIKISVESAQELHWLEEDESEEEVTKHPPT